MGTRAMLAREEATTELAEVRTAVSGGFAGELM
jgi:hypothetical protein